MGEIAPTLHYNIAPSDLCLSVAIFERMNEQVNDAQSGDQNRRQLNRKKVDSWIPYMERIFEGNSLYKYIRREFYGNFYHT